MDENDPPRLTWWACLISSVPTFPGPCDFHPITLPAIATSGPRPQRRVAQRRVAPLTLTQLLGPWPLSRTPNLMVWLDLELTQSGYPAQAPMSLTALYLLAEAWGEVSWADLLKWILMPDQTKGLLVMALSETLMKAVAPLPIDSTFCITFGVSKTSKSFLEEMDPEVHDLYFRGCLST